MYFLEVFTLLILSYVFILIFLRFKYYKSRLKSKNCINCCPKCKYPLQRLKTNIKIKLLNFITLNIFQFLRFYCKNCNWNGFLAKYSKKLQNRKNNS